LAQRHLLSRKDIRRLIRSLRERGYDITRLKQAERVEVVKYRELKGVTIYVFENIPTIITLEDKRYGFVILPCLMGLLKGVISWKKKVFVDRGGAVRIVDGADVMVPGIKAIEGEFDRNEIVVVYDLESKVPIAVGVSLMSSKEILTSKKGRAIKNLHYANDKIMKLLAYSYGL